jgi:hypothetical protein
VVLCHGPAAKLLPLSFLRSQLVLPVQLPACFHWNHSGSHIWLSHRRRGPLSLLVYIHVETPSVVVAGFCDWSRSTTMGADALGHKFSWLSSTMGWLVCRVCTSLSLSMAVTWPSRRHSEYWCGPYASAHAHAHAHSRFRKVDDRASTGKCCNYCCSRFGFKKAGARRRIPGYLDGLEYRTGQTLVMGSAGSAAGDLCGISEVLPQGTDKQTLVVLIS